MNDYEKGKFVTKVLKGDFFLKYLFYFKGQKLSQNVKYFVKSF